FAETTRSGDPAKYNAATYVSFSVGSLAAMLSILAASSAATSCLASGVDFDSRSCAQAGGASTAATRTAAKDPTARGIVPPQRFEGLFIPQMKSTSSSSARWRPGPFRRISRTALNPARDAGRSAGPLRAGTTSDDC